ncbi:type II secretion system F family protein [Allorhodopirellula solitaria]|uniref:Bacterial type II secretion system protein F domain protein n=1 Tax=Allorhodopirellula solitaria TaxID=2527987 RepID=A0A5C5YFR6_9BACT|nr:type II secretion system F family protein [Allorhodopirellula solitaria]TWT73331.1 Bacterial type II secretion system protein F domain protein [Allorhodopirellula solitaria]
MSSLFLTLPLLLAFTAVAFLAARYLFARERTLARWHSDMDVNVALDSSSPRGWLSGWLFLAGYRSVSAPWVFVGAMTACTLFGLGAATLFVLSGLQGAMERTVVLVPGGVGDTFLPVVWVAPWIMAILLICIPVTTVRSARRKRVALIEQDLPLAMELMATLSEAGLSFDSALLRVLRTRLAGRPLANELNLYHADLLAGRPRIQSLRRLSGRVRIGSISILVSALVQAEQMGMGIAKVLRTQADDIRARRRERAIAFANALPVKRLFPLVICFLPGLFVWTLGPAFVQLFKLTETFTSGGGL